MCFELQMKGAGIIVWADTSDQGHFSSRQKLGTCRSQVRLIRGPGETRGPAEGRLQVASACRFGHN
jgi:hypothetical protein